MIRVRRQCRQKKKKTGTENGNNFELLAIMSAYTTIIQRLLCWLMDLLAKIIVIIVSFVLFSAFFDRLLFCFLYEPFKFVRKSKRPRKELNSTVLCLYFLEFHKMPDIIRLLEFMPSLPHNCHESHFMSKLKS